MKTLKSRSTTSRKKKLPSAFPARTKAVKCFYCAGTGAAQSDRAYKLGRSDERFSFTEYGSAYRRQREALQRARKQTRELKREVTRLNALVVKLAEKI